MTNAQRFDSALYGVAPTLRSALQGLSDTVKEKIEEIRLRSGLPVALTVGGECAFVLKSGQISRYISRDLLKAEDRDITESFRLLCRSSVYAHAEELKNGFLMMKYGHRAGLCGTVARDGGLHDISSINIRIAREIKGCADLLAATYRGGGLLLAGPPGSGKTTLLRDLIRQLSDGTHSLPRRIAVIDSRGELSGTTGGRVYHDLGGNSDVMVTPDKAAGIEMALRTLFPDLVAFDEIGTVEELRGVSESFSAGVDILTTAHIGSVQDIPRRLVTRKLLESGAIARVAVLPPSHHGKITFFEGEELIRACPA